MKYKRIIRDKSNRLFFKHVELKQYVTFLLARSIYGYNNYGWAFFKKKKFSRITVKNYCILSGRSRGVLQDFKLSRILLRKMGSKGFLFGLKKKSW